MAEAGGILDVLDRQLGGGAAAVPPPTATAPAADPKKAAVSGGASALLQGLTFGFSDEATAAIRSLVGNTPYGEAVAQERAALDEFRTENPKTAIGLEIVGAAPTALVPLGWAARSIQAARVARGAGQVRKGGRVALGIAGGATGATVAEIGAGEGDALDRLMDINPLAPVFGAGAGAAGETLANFAPRVLGALVNAVKTKAPRDKARQIIQEAMDADGVTPEKLLEVLNSPRAGLETLADQGPSLRGRAETSLSIPGSEKQGQFIASRHSRVSQRIKDDLSKALGVDKEYFGTLDEMSARQKTAAAELYSKAYAGAPIEVDEILDFAKDPTFQEAYKRGYAILAREAVADGTAPPPKLNTDNPAELVALPINVIDAVQRGISEMINQGKRSGADTRSLIRFKNALLDRVDNLAPDYAAARRAWAGDAALIDALESGRNFLSDNFRPEELERELLRMTPSELDAFRIGVMESFGSLLDSGGGMKILRAFSNPQLRGQLRALVPDKAAFEKFEQVMQREAAFAETYQQTLGSSRTAVRRAGQEQLAVEQPPASLGDLVNGMIRELAAVDIDERSLIAKEMARVLLSPDPVKAMSPTLANRLNRAVKTAFIAPTVKTGFRAATTVAPGTTTAVGLEQGREE